MNDQPDDTQHRAQGQPPPNWGSAYPPPPGPGFPPPAGQQGWPAGPPRHPQATTSLVLGILGLAVCGVLAPFAWYIGQQAVRQIDAAPWSYSGRSEANAGRILGIVGTALIAAGVLAVVGLVSVSFMSVA